ncbi:hypothetical protein C1646_765694 [Rhizophagus diaphanus]|nr:hypothetical protein C1646_765694 [Rhizophagus diaphanus] [Rhizophagus sp. MUCL 43196]
MAQVVPFNSNVQNQSPSLMIKNNLASLADESITKLFKSPGKNICEQEEFVSVLAKLDERLKYMQTNILGWKKEQLDREFNSTGLRAALFYVKFKTMRNLIPVVYTNIQELEPTGQDTSRNNIEPLSELSTMLQVHLNQDSDKNGGMDMDID